MATPSPAASTSRIDEERENELYREFDKARRARAEDEAAVESDTPLSTAVQTKASMAPKVTKRPPPVFMNNGKSAPKLRGSTAATHASVKPVRSPLTTSTPSIAPVQPTPPAPAKPPPKNTEKRKITAPEATLGSDVEELQFGMPTKRTRTSISPPAATAPLQSSSMQLSLPGLSNTGGIVLPGHQPTPPAPEDEEDEDEEWDEVPVNNADAQATEMEKFAEAMEKDLVGGFFEEDPGAEGEDGNDDNEGDDGDDLFGDTAETAEQEQDGASQGPISLNAYVGGEAVDGAVDDDDDDYSSDESSDDD